MHLPTESENAGILKKRINKRTLGDPTRIHQMIIICKQMHVRNLLK